nr:putative type VI secretion system effector [Hafnia alvei]
MDNILSTEPVAPDLPPRAPLIKVAGVLEEFSVLKVIGYFSDSEYDLERFRTQEKKDLAGGLLLAIAGNVAGSAVTSMSSTRKNDACDFIQGKINGKNFQGWLGKTNASVGDYVEMAVVDKGNSFIVYAIAIPDLCTISITPRCDMGRWGALKDGFNFSIWFFSIFIFIVSASMFIFSDVSFLFVLKSILIPVVIFIAIFLAVSISMVRSPNSTVLLAEDIFETLDMPMVTHVNLKHITKKRLRKIKSGKYTMGHIKNRILPDSWYFVDYLYYYK